MASPEFAIAKAHLSAALLRKDHVLPACTRDDVGTFNSLFNDVVNRCSPQNVQKCKRWILKDVVASPARATALGKYLVAAANSFVDGAGGRPSAKRKRLHVLYLLHDVLYHTLRRHPGNDDFARSIRGCLEPLFSSVASFPGVPKHTARILDLLAFWDEKRLFDADVVAKLRALVEAAAAEKGNATSKDAPQTATSEAFSKLPKEAPFILPSVHGDPSMAWFDLPAANWLPHLAPNSTKPMKPDMIKPLQFAQGPADKPVVEAVKTLLAKVDQLFSKGRTWDEHADMNEMGESVILDEVTGEVVGGETYYGWSRGFCKKMKDRRTGPEGQGDRSRGRSRSRSDSRSSRSSYRSGSSTSAQKHKRRRLSRSRSPRKKWSESQPGSAPAVSLTLRAKGAVEDALAIAIQDGTPAPFYPSVPPVPPPGQQIPPPPQHQQYPMPPMPPIPPPPYGYTGQWPPPPPPPPPFQPGGFARGWNAGAPPPAPPPGPPAWGGGQNQQFNHGRGGGNYRGDYGRGARGRGW
ncbi:uncharacterized protein DNG_02004 [Cephalotrichum gorgonifer]|uniref:CID domain-containing protein n=1 Tax=Cephalotrichum gorgonifer TaxID=2041049 RepID=A0AAE8SSB1_9PEZI|nr:uncharacterized protein DNG_02004 [Cephalotrichum gorgonifer]